MNNQQLAEEITARFTPLVFTCECNGDHPSCKMARNNASVYTQMETVKRIAEYIIQKGE
jgi:hypothetical protein